MRTIGLAALTILVVSAPAAAQTVAEDARCLLVSSTYARNAKDPKARSVAQAASAFFLGRVDGRYPPAALKAALVAELKTVSAASASSIMNACAARVMQAETRVQGAAPAPKPAVTPTPAPAPTPTPVPARPAPPVGR